MSEYDFFVVVMVIIGYINLCSISIQFGMWRYLLVHIGQQQHKQQQHKQQHEQHNNNNNNNHHKQHYDSVYIFQPYQVRDTTKLLASAKQAQKEKTDLLFVLGGIY